MGDYGYGIFLEVIRRQPVVFGAHKRFEEPPGAARDQPGEAQILAAQFSAFGRLCV